MEKSRNLLERLVDHEDKVLRFLTNPDVPFTNNQGKIDIRMTKIPQKHRKCRAVIGVKVEHHMWAPEWFQIFFIFGGFSFITSKNTQL